MVSPVCYPIPLSRMEANGRKICSSGPLLKGQFVMKLSRYGHSEVNVCRLGEDNFGFVAHSYVPRAPFWIRGRDGCRLPDLLWDFRAKLNCIKVFERVN